MCGDDGLDSSGSVHGTVTKYSAQGNELRYFVKTSHSRRTGVIITCSTGYVKSNPLHFLRMRRLLGRTLMPVWLQYEGSVYAHGNDKRRKVTRPSGTEFYSKLKISTEVRG